MKTLLEFDYQKAVQVANYFATKEKDKKIDKLKLMKLVYFADRVHLRRFGRPIINDTYWAMEYGPVASGMKDLVSNSDFLSEQESTYAAAFISNSGQHQVVSIAELDQNVFSETDLAVLNEIYEQLGDMSSKQLVDLTHKNSDWAKFEDDLKSGSTRKMMSYVDFFDPNNSHDDENSEKLQLMQDLFKESYQLAQHWG